jgi:hypothetical protein
MKQRFRWTIRLSKLTPMLFLLVIILMGAGHGIYSPTIVLFPWGMIGVTFQDSITLPFIVLAIFQYPMYGLILDQAWNRNSTNWFAASLVILHMILVVLIFKYKSDTFS